MHKPLQGVDTADAHIEFVGAKEFNSPAEPFSDLALLVETLCVRLAELVTYKPSTTASTERKPTTVVVIIWGQSDLARGSLAGGLRLPP